MFLLTALTLIVVALQLSDRLSAVYKHCVYGGKSLLLHRINSLRYDFAAFRLNHGFSRAFLWGDAAKKVCCSFVKALGKFFLNPYTFISIMLAMDFCFVFSRLLKLKWQLLPYLESLPGYAYFWIGLYSIVVFNIALIFTYGLYSRFTKPKELPRVFLKEAPATAIVYTIRGEGSGLFERMAYTFSNNYLPNVDLWILSGDTAEKYLAYERSVVLRLRRSFGESRVNYFHSTNPKVKKAQIIELWLNNLGSQYKYFIICDADSMLPPNVALKFLRYAEHPQNKDVSIFQSSLRGANPQTYYSAWQAAGIEKIMKTEVPVNHQVFGTMLYMGHNALVRVEDFKHIQTPTNTLSHDIWDSAFLDVCGKKIAFCHDVISYEQTPATFLEDIKRIGRWSRGNLQTIRLLFRRGISVGTRFQIFYGIYTYIMQPIFVFWIAMGLGQTQQQMWRGLSGLSIRELSGFLTVLFILLFNDIISDFSLSPKRVGRIIVNFMYSTVISINIILYNTINIFQMPFSKISWIPMKKNPHSSLTLTETVEALWPGTLIGLGLLIMAQYYPYWFIIASPLIFGLVFSIPVVYLTGRESAPRRVYG